MNDKKTTRTWTTCTGCNSAVIASFIQASGLCKVCDARRLTKIISVPAERNADLRAGSADFGQTSARYYMPVENENGDLTAGEEISPEDLRDLPPYAVVIDQDGAEMVVADLGMTAEDRQLGKKRTTKLEAQADALLAYADAHAEILALGQTNPTQMLMNKARMALGIELVKDGTQPKLLTDKQAYTLTKVLGHDKDLVRQARLSISEASRLMQRGPTWKK